MELDEAHSAATRTLRKKSVKPPKMPLKCSAKQMTLKANAAAKEDSALALVSPAGLDGSPAAMLASCTAAGAFRERCKRNASRQRSPSMHSHPMEVRKQQEDKVPCRKKEPARHHNVCAHHAWPQGVMQQATPFADAGSRAEAVKCGKVASSIKTG